MEWWNDVDLLIRLEVGRMAHSPTFSEHRLSAFGGGFTRIKRGRRKEIWRE